MIKCSAKIDRIKDLFLSKRLSVFVLTHRNAARSKGELKTERSPNILIHNGKKLQDRFPVSRSKTKIESLRQVSASRKDFSFIPVGGSFASAGGITFPG